MNEKEIELYQVDIEEDFQKEVRRFVKKKNFRTLTNQIEELIIKVKNGEFEGDKIIISDYPTPHDIYKLRLPVPDIKVGKSNGYRIIYMVVTEYKIVVFLIIYYKKEQPTVSDTYIHGLIDGYFINSSPEEE